ncbi:very short patch repair endonuclease [Paraburkholderia sp. SOS3]|uniref:very short patch repair endonuclease n=1 Tax=Paraburkholderia sp. SOS3 TaxID=1926494 RepID=UPI0018DE71A8|nr:very short patch repair endonuclease [Paraburkholderia sp. SOS3]
MIDTVSRDQRSRNMAAVSNKDTLPEILVRRALHRLGYRFRLHRSDLPGTPDIVLPKYKLCIFVHGCFWHRHAGCKRASTPSTNVEFWKRKFEKNVNRDAATVDRLTKMGWRVEVIWTCQTSRSEDLMKVLNGCLSGTKP